MLKSGDRERRPVSMKWYVAAVLLLVAAMTAVAGCGEEPEAETTTGSYIDVSPAEARELIDNNPDLIIIDVSPHYDQGHLPGAVHYYLGDGSLDDAIPTLDKDATYLVYCHVDSVAIAGAQKLIDAGFTKVYRLEGNYGAWVDAGYEVEK
jgi:adenylyltransferase/sulfurtransferase